jgi:hypothetical protein
MASFFSWLRACFAPAQRSQAPARTVRPALEGLSERIMPSVSYHGGPVLEHVDAHTVFYGQNWNTSDSYGIGRAYLDQYVSDITQSPYMAMLGEYGVGRGSFGGYDNVTDSSSPTTTVQDSQIQTMLQIQILQGNLPWERGQQLYIVYLAPGVVSQYDQVSSFSPTGTLGHHGSFVMPNPSGWPQPVYYAVIEHPSVWPSGNLTGLSTTQQLTEVTSHELAEAATDPDVRVNDSGVQGGGNTAWWDSTPGTWNGYQYISNPTYKDEIGDIVNQQHANFVANGHTYTVQKEWSNYFGTGILANGDQSWMLDYSYHNYGQFSYESSYWWNNSGDSVYSYYASGWDGRTYHNYNLAGGGQSGWFTIDA